MSSNDLREQSGADTITDVVWIYKPKLYRDKNIVEYSFKVTWRSKNGEMYNNNCIAFRKVWIFIIPLLLIIEIIN